MLEGLLRCSETVLMLAMARLLMSYGGNYLTK
jgi:hypothetical protein